jgi:hypothetical protein
LEIVAVFVQIVGLRRFETPGMPGEPRVVHNVAEAFQANLALPNVGVPVHA